MTTLRTERLLLRAFGADDLAMFAALNAHPAVARMLGSSPTRAQSDAMVERYTEELNREGWGLWALEVVDGSSFVGFCGLHAVPEYLPCYPGVEIGWRLDPAHWGNGYATEAAGTALAYGFGSAGLSEIVSFTAAVNLPSQAVMRRIGMTRDLDGDFEHPNVPIEGDLRPHVLYRIQPGPTLPK
ncbi:MAG TPA: GNAT family N-acetyltransferase [Acidimicrobiales bacterium]